MHFEWFWMFKSVLVFVHVYTCTHAHTRVWVRKTPSTYNLDMNPLESNLMPSENNTWQYQSTWPPQSHSRNSPYSSTQFQQIYPEHSLAMLYQFVHHHVRDQSVSERPLKCCLVEIISKWLKTCQKKVGPTYQEDYCISHFNFNLIVNLYFQVYKKI